MRWPDEDHLTEDQILDLLLDLLPEAEWLRLTTHVAACPTCEESLRTQGAELERLRAARGYRAILAGSFAGDSGDAVATFPESGRATARTAPVSSESLPAARLRPSRPRKGSRGARGPRAAFGRSGGLLAVGLGLAALVVFGFFLRRSGSPDQDGLPWLPVSGIVQLRGDQSGPGEAVQRALTAYDQHDLDHAIPELQAASASGTWESLRRIYLGSALAQNGRFSEASRWLSTVNLGDVPEPWRSDAYLTLLAALRRSGQASRADSLARVMAANPGEAGKRARALLKARRD